MNIFTTFKQTAYTYSQRNGSNTWTGEDSGQVYHGLGVFKPRGMSDMPQLSTVETAEPTLNVKASEPFINRADPSAMEGDSVIVPSDSGQTFKIVGVTTAKNFRTGNVEHYRLHLQEVAQ